MGILRDFERRLEGAVEGFFARLFRSGLQPVELAKALQRYAGSYQQIGVAGVFVPNRYRFDLSHEDHERFSGFLPSLQRELADVVRKTASERGWQLQGPVRVELRASDQVAVGTYELRGKVESEERPAPDHPGAESESGPRRAPPAAAPTPRPPHARAPRPVEDDDLAGAAVERTVILSPDEPQPALHVLNGPRPGQRIELQGTTLVGRLPECDVQLDDTSVSRRHARLVKRPGGWSIEDLDSTNGVQVNGTSVSQTTLEDGDTIELGGIRMTFTMDS